MFTHRIFLKFNQFLAKFEPIMNHYLEIVMQNKIITAIFDPITKSRISFQNYCIFDIMRHNTLLKINKLNFTELSSTVQPI